MLLLVFAAGTSVGFAVGWVAALCYLCHDPGVMDVESEDTDE